MAREAIMEVARRVYRSYGFSPIDTPALEYTEVLLGKGGEESDKQLFRFTDNGGRDVAMRFDLTVPFARFAAQHLNDIGVPFKRYHLAPVWRGENTQRGRYREFMQCDFDTIGTDSNAADIETLLVIHDLLSAIGFERFRIRINNRLVLNGLLEKLGLGDRASGVLRALDKLHKIGRDGVTAELCEKVQTTTDQAARVLDFAHLTGTPSEILSRLDGMLQGNATGELGVARLRELFSVASHAGIPPERVDLDVSIARGLDYYTGTIYETFLTDDPKIGSICSGGRYDNLAGLFTSQKLPGVGASLGLDRLLAAMESFGMIGQASTPAPVLVVSFDATRVAEYARLGRMLRQAGINTEVFPDSRAVGKQLKYADKKGFRIAVIAGEDEFAAGVWQVKDLKAGTQSRVAEADLPSHLNDILKPA
ncbi:MAG TPA: histidine--tRNA ligase [Planctomycetaceae bacterium]|jgi:histidyl-tRNA synthetase|nr:histidine--tRNA ligase [Planctomycetaceae bacterium]